MGHGSKVISWIGFFIVLLGIYLNSRDIIESYAPIIIGFVLTFIPFIYKKMMK